MKTNTMTIACSILLMTALSVFDAIPSEAASRRGSERFEYVLQQQLSNVLPTVEQDGASPDALIAALYDVISGAAGQKRDWARFRALFHSSARLMASVSDTSKGANGSAVRVMTPEEYIKGSGAVLESRGFFERELLRRTEQYGHILHAFSTYESRTKVDDAKPFMRGINSIQLLNDGKRWWILSVLWDSERPTQPIPNQYLPQR